MSELGNYVRCQVCDCNIGVPESGAGLSACPMCRLLAEAALLRQGAK